MIRIEARTNEPIEKTLKRFKKQCEKEGLVKDIKKSAYYEKPCDRKRRRIRNQVKKILKDRAKADKIISDATAAARRGH